MTPPFPVRSFLIAELIGVRSIPIAIVWANTAVDALAILVGDAPRARVSLHWDLYPDVATGSVRNPEHRRIQAVVAPDVPVPYHLTEKEEG